MDRNAKLVKLVSNSNITSLSARRAWIEISVSRYTPTPKPVALRKESVDRNNNTSKKKKIKPVALRKESVDRNYCRTEWKTYLDKSLSARRAWIEITSLFLWVLCTVVALRKESVDRNSIAHSGCDILSSRSPQGERG